MAGLSWLSALLAGRHALQGRQPYSRGGTHMMKPQCKDGHKVLKFGPMTTDKIVQLGHLSPYQEVPD